jgi:hypothetical protein
MKDGRKEQVNSQINRGQKGRTVAPFMSTYNCAKKSDTPTNCHITM